MRSWLRWLTWPRNRVTVDSTTGLLTLSLLWLHSVRRLFESLFVSVYSDTEMNVLHYLTGLAHYFLLPLVVVAETSGFLTATEFSTSVTSIGPMQLLGVLMFLLCSFNQHQCLTKFASMRRNHLGNITNYAHGIPFGGLFDLVSCPHFLYEIGIYASLFLCLKMAHHLWVYVLIFVVINQTIAALITHKWYSDRFKSQYPADRKALIPFIL
uniref:Polyprenal reductase n=1 Tax=Plectus sambesii TaxID=2011161 RepID=A0A914W2I4_9BILA